MRVLHVSKTANGGRFIGFQIEHLVKNGIDVHLALPGDGKLSEMAVRSGATLHYIPALGGRIDKAARALRNLLQDLKPDLVHTHFVHSTLVTRLSRLLSTCRCPILFQVPGPLHLENRISRLIDTCTASRIDHWGAACQWTHNRYLKSGIGSDRVHLAYYGKNLEDFESDEEARVSCRSELGSSDDEILVFMVAHIYPPRKGKKTGIKGHEDFIEAIKIASENNSAIRGVVVGGARPGAERYAESLITFATSTGAPVEFLGHRNDVTRLYRGADIAVHPSHSENLGGAGESLLLRVPTISTNVGGFPDIVKHGVTGLTVPPRNPSELAKAILHMSRNLDWGRQAAVNGRKIVEQVGDAKLNAKRVFDIYHKMLIETK